jgi:hypothetical protein
MRDRGNLPAREHVMPPVPLDVGDAIELAELLQFLGSWLESDRGNLAGALARFIGSTAYGPDSLREDFAWFRFLLGSPTAKACSHRTSRECPPTPPATALSSPGAGKEPRLQARTWPSRSSGAIAPVTGCPGSGRAIAGEARRTHGHRDRPWPPS